MIRVRIQKILFSTVLLTLAAVVIQAGSGITLVAENTVNLKASRAIFSLIPMLCTGGAGSEIQKQFATAVVGG